MAEKFSDEPKAETKVANQTTLAEKTDEYRWVRWLAIADAAEQAVSLKARPTYST